MHCKQLQYISTNKETSRKQQSCKCTKIIQFRHALEIATPTRIPFQCDENATSMCAHIVTRCARGGGHEAKAAGAHVSMPHEVGRLKLPQNRIGDRRWLCKYKHQCSQQRPGTCMRTTDTRICNHHINAVFRLESRKKRDRRASMPRGRRGHRSNEAAVGTHAIARTHTHTHTHNHAYLQPCAREVNSE